jgi:hypothetical protein
MKSNWSLYLGSLKGVIPKTINYNTCQGSGRMRTYEDACVEGITEKPPFPWSTTS